jgi:hypothetical protein
MFKFSITDVGINFLPVQLADVETTAGTPPENESFLPFAKHSIEELIAKDKLRCLIQLANAAFVDFALVNLTVVLAFWDYQQRLLQTSSIEILCYHKSIANMRLDDIIFLSPILSDIAIGITDIDIRKYCAKTF